MKAAREKELQVCGRIYCNTTRTEETATTPARTAASLMLKRAIRLPKITMQPEFRFRLNALTATAFDPLSQLNQNLVKAVEVLSAGRGKPKRSRTRCHDPTFPDHFDSGLLIVSPVAHAPSLTRMGVATDRIINVGTFTEGQKVLNK